MKNNDLKQNGPIIFTNKVNNKHKVIPLNLTVNTGGPVKHFLPATKEWSNSIYAYNNNSIRNLSIADKNLSKLIKSYFNFYFNNKKIKTKGVAMRFRRLIIKKIFVSKAEVKHTNSKVIVTLYVYNEEKRDLNRKIKRLTSIVFPSNNILYYKNFWKNKRPLHYVEKINTWLYEYNRTPLLTWISNNISHYLKELILEREKFSSIKKNKVNLKDVNISNRRNLLNGLERWIDINFFSMEKYNNLLSLDTLYFDFLYWIHISKEYKAIKYYKTLLNLNKVKFNGFFIEKLKPLISHLYNKKEVEFNIVNLKTLYFNSDIFTQAIALKLKQRKNILIKVLKSALFLVKLPKVNLIKERYNKEIIKSLWNNKVKNLKVNSLINLSHKFTNNSNKDILNNSLLEIFHSSCYINDNNININCKESNKNSFLLDFILKNLKHKNMAGVRLEAKGRLTRRLTASRSVFKIRWKGGLRNIDSSYRGLSAVMLRGHVKSNVQYSIMSSKTRNGAFGLKGWISSK